MDRLDFYTSITPSPRQLEIQSLGFYAFLHFGMNTFLDREWSDGKASPSLFCPTQLDTDQWVRALRNAGLRGAILTAKHHDGFCLWPSRLTDYTVASSPYRGGTGDIVGELARSCAKYGLKLGLYLSPWDRHDARYGTPAYDDFYVGQLTELLTNYGEIFTVWLDGACGTYLDGKPKQAYDFERYYETIRRLQPGCIISNCGPDVRWLGNEGGITRRSEWNVVPRFAYDIQTIEKHSQQTDDTAFRKKGADIAYSDLGSRKALEGYDELIWYPAEADVSIRPGWFYHQKEDSKIRSIDNLLYLYYSTVGGNTLLLLNVPPDRRGLIHEKDAARLAELGRRLHSAFSRQVLFERITAPEGKEGFSIKNCLRPDDGCYSPLEQADRYTLLLDFKQEALIDKAALQEDTRYSQRVEAFTIEAWVGGRWKQVYGGTVIGFGKIALFRPVLTRKLKITITACRKEPYLRSIQVFENDGTEVKMPKTLWLRKKAEELNYRLFIDAEKHKANSKSSK